MNTLTLIETDDRIRRSLGTWRRENSSDGDDEEKYEKPLDTLNERVRLPTDVCIFVGFESFSTSLSSKLGMFRHFPTSPISLPLYTFPFYIQFYSVNNEKRFSDRSEILNVYPYAVRIELYQTRKTNEEQSLVVVWKYPVTFDYLPVYRLAKVLHLTAFSEHKNPCFSHSCHRNERCQQLMNNRSEHICLCPVNFTGDNCSSKDQRICLGLAVFRPPLFIEDAYPRRISLPSWVKRCIKFFRKARFSFRPTLFTPRVRYGKIETFFHTLETSCSCS